MSYKTKDYTKNVIAYISTSEFDTEIDSINIQRKRITDWCDKYGYTILYEYIDLQRDNEFSETQRRVFLDAFNTRARVIVSSLCRLSYDLRVISHYIENPRRPLITAEITSVPICNKHKVQEDLSLHLLSAMYEKQRRASE